MASPALLPLSVLCVSTFLVFLAYSSMQNLESSVSKGTGTTAVGVIYVSIILGTPFAPKVIGLLGRKWSSVFSTCTYVVFVASNLYPKLSVMIPAAVIIGLGGSVFWPTTLSLLKHFSARRAKALGGDENKTLDHFSSIFWGVFQLSQLTGSLMIFLIFSKGGDDGQSSEKLLALIFTATCAMGCLCTAALLENVDEGGFVEEQQQQQQQEEKDVESDKVASKGGADLKFALKLLMSPQSFLLFGIYVYNGMEQGFAWCNFTSGMVLAAYEKEAMIGILMLCYAAANALTSITTSQLSSSGAMTRGLIFLAIVSQTACVLVTNQILKDQKVALYVTAIFLGAGDALLNTKIGVLLGSDFKGKTHVIMVTIWRGFTSAGCAVPFFLSNHTGIDFDVLMLVGVGMLAVISFAFYCRLNASEKEEAEQYEPILSGD